MPQENYSATHRSYTAGHFEMKLDGERTTAYLKSVDGGWPKHSLVSEPIGPYNQQIKHASVAEIDPITFEMGVSGANSVLQWIQSSWKKEPATRSGQITHANFNGYATLEHEFSDAHLTEVTFPTLDGSSKEAAYLKVKCQPETVAIRKGGGNKLEAIMSSAQKLWLCSGFRFKIDGIDGMEYTNKIESFTIKQGVKRMQVGTSRYGELMPTKLEFPQLSGTIAMGYANKLLDWHKQTVHGDAGKARHEKSHRTAMLEFLAPNKNKVLFRINMDEVGLLSTQMIQSTANSDQIKRLKFDLYVGAMELDGSGALGLQ
jgi:hypothetical protein